VFDSDGGFGWPGSGGNDCEEGGGPLGGTVDNLGPVGKPPRGKALGTLLSGPGAGAERPSFGSFGVNGDVFKPFSWLAAAAREPPVGIDGTTVLETFSYPATGAKGLPFGANGAIFKSFSCPGPGAKGLSLCVNGAILPNLEPDDIG
jgi:hypothetical protein